MLSNLESAKALDRPTASTTLAAPIFMIFRAFYSLISDLKASFRIVLKLDYMLVYSGGGLGVTATALREVLKSNLAHKTSFQPLSESKPNHMGHLDPL